MRRETQIELLDELLGLRKAESAYLDESVTYSQADRYLDPERFEREQQKLFFELPIMVAHSSELAEDGAFMRKELAGRPIFLTRDRDGKVNAFYNICRHRGSRLVQAEQGCRHRFTCPYHAWTWDNKGNLIAAPHREQGFPDLDFAQYALKRIQCFEVHGWIWCLLDDQQPDFDINQYLEPLMPDLPWLEMENLEAHVTDDKIWNCNWKVLVEGGLEAYHFRIAHAKTIGSFFHDNLSTYRQFGNHLRSVLARVTIDELVEKPRKEWNIREHTNILYNIFPNSVWLVQSDHIVWVRFEPVSVNQTRIKCTTMRPRQETELTESKQSYWDKNHNLTITTLNEDFELGEQIQTGLNLGVNDQLTFGRFEGALDRFNAIVDEVLEGNQA